MQLHDFFSINRQEFFPDHSISTYADRAGLKKKFYSERKVFLSRRVGEEMFCSAGLFFGFLMIMHPSALQIWPGKDSCFKT